MNIVKNTKTVLVVAAHPDDEVLGCAGVVADYVNNGIDVSILVLGEGVTSRFEEGEKDARTRALAQIRESVNDAAGILGVKKTFIFNFPDNRFDTVALLDIVKTIESVKDEVRPDIVYTHHYNDLNIDHRIAYNAVLTACRPIKEETVKEIYSFEIPSSTEWNYPYVFSPNIFVDITGTIDKKIEALKAYRTELKESPHPRSEELVRTTARRWGSVVGLNYAEAFEAIRIIR